MLVLDESLRMQHAAGAIEQIIGTGWIGQPLGAVVDEELVSKIAAVSVPGASGGLVGQMRTLSGELLDVSVFLSAPHIVLEFEQSSIATGPASLVLDALEARAASFELALSLAALCEYAAVAFRQLTGFDRVMVYRFLDGGVGSVVGESRDSGQRSFMNQHFPASDIPAQARALYIRNLVRVIPDAAYLPAPLRPAWSAPVPLDMTDSSLRSVSPIHIQYLLNMGVKASASISIVKDGLLWGLIACHHVTPRSLSYEVRAACRSLAGSLARQIKAKEEAETYRQRIRLRSVEDDVMALLARHTSLDEGLACHLPEIGRLLGSDGVAILRGTELLMDGVYPTEREIRDLVEWLSSRPSETIFSTDRLSADYPPAAAFETKIAGVIAVILSTDQPWFILWFNAEQIEIVNWAGNPHKETPGDPAGLLTPRASFAAWAETVRGRARTWLLPELDAAVRLGQALIDLEQIRVVQALNIQLTGLVRDKDFLLQQKEFLIGEINHRVQNSLALISSFLMLQARASDTPQLREGLEEAQRRVAAVGLVHRRLYDGGQLGVVDGGQYIKELCTDAFSFMGQDWIEHLALDLMPVLIPIERAITLGLVLTELLINANKYAYEGSPGPIEVSLVEDLSGLRMTVADRGVGIVPGRRGFGSRIMEALVRQLGGTLTQSDNRPGLRTEISMSVPAVEPALTGAA
jgi:light-regulated signal transduction histidine kinase (bacteriophytochrome)